MTAVPTNLRVLRPSRKRPQPGDVFAIQPLDDTYLFGRVISVEAKWTLAEGADPAVLVYIYRKRSTSKQEAGPAALRPDQLLVSPIMTNRLPWSRGYFENVAHVPLESDDVLSQHCFLSASRGRYFDDHGRVRDWSIDQRRAWNRVWVGRHR